MFRQIATCSGLSPICLLLVACATQAPIADSQTGMAEGLSTRIDLERPMHFTGPDGNPVGVPAGLYDVKAGGNTMLHLSPSHGGTPLAIVAAPSPTPYRADQTEPLAVAIPGEDEDTLHILLAQVDGAGLEAAGSYSGIQPRAPGLFLSPAKGQLYVETKAYTSSAQPRVTAPVVSAPQAPTLTAPITITPGPNVPDFQECVGLTGYVNSIVTTQIVSLLLNGRPPVALWDQTLPHIVLAGNPGQAPVQSVPGGVTYPNTPFMRIFPKNPYRCMFGSVTVSTRNLMAGGKVRLKMTVRDVTPGRTWLIADHYELPMTASGIVTFGKVVVSSVSLQQINRDRTDEPTFVINALKTLARSGALVKIEASIDGGASAQRECLYKPVIGAPGAGTLTCK